MGLISWTVEKLNPAQSLLSNYGTEEASTTSPVYTYQQCYEQLEVVNRGVNMLVDDVSNISTTIGDQIPNIVSRLNVRKATIDKLLNKQPNPFQDISSFKRSLLMDFILDGNMFMYFDGAALYQLPSTRVTVVSDAKNYVSHYEFDGNLQKFTPDEIIHVKDNSYKTIYRGSSRLEPALRTMKIIMEMRNFQDNFFKNGAVPGLVLKSENVLNERLKQRLTDEWSKKFRPGTGGRRPIILDGGLEIDTISNVSFQDLDFQDSIKACEETVLKALGIPPIILDTGNNANIRPNHRLYYLETIIPIVNKINSALSNFFGFDIYEDVTYVEALRPELADQASYLQSLTVAGIISRNEARDQLGYPPMPGHDDLVIPANVAGSALNPTEGGKPAAPKDQSNGK